MIEENIIHEKVKEIKKQLRLAMNGIVSSLLSYNKLQQLTEIKKEECNLSELVREETEYYRSFAEKSGVTIKENITDDVYAQCNPQLIKMAIDNYLSNAIKHSTGDKIVEINLRKHLGVFTIEVINPADENNVKIANKAWDEFSRGDNSRQRQGESIGMGLAICKKIFELHKFSGYCKYNDGKVSFFLSGN